MSEPNEAEPLLRVRDLVVTFATDGGVVRALDGISFEVPKGSTVGLVGESGAGKSVTAFSILRLIPTPPGAIERGEILFEGKDLLRLPERELRRVRGGSIGMIFQEPMTALNPVYSVGAQVVEALRLHRDVSRKAAKEATLALFRRVGLDRPADRFDAYPHELSGGMRQRVMIAMALACSPALLIADEPTTAVDMMTQAQIMGLLAELRAETQLSLLLVAHDLTLVASVCEQIVVLYAGEVVEQGSARVVLETPRHPYTRALLGCSPPLQAEQRRRGRSGRRLPTIEGEAPDMRSIPDGCRFAPRCDRVEDRCRREAPLILPVGDGENRAQVRCFVAQRDDARGEPRS